MRGQELRIKAKNKALYVQSRVCMSDEAGKVDQSYIIKPLKIDKRRLTLLPVIKEKHEKNWGKLKYDEIAFQRNE